MPGSILESATTEVAPTLEIAASRSAPRRGLWRRVLRSPTGVVGLTMVLVIVFAAVFADSIAPYDPFDSLAGPSLTAPSADHPFGLDNTGRDVFSGVVQGTRTSMLVVFWVVLLSTIIGMVVGVVAGYRGGLLDDVSMRMAELFQVVPRFFLALLVISFWGPGLNHLILLLGLTSWPFLARLVRIETIRLKQRDFVEVARSLGASGPRIVVRHLIPNLIPPVLVAVGLFASRVIMIEAGLSFLGLGDPDRISLGFMANNAQDFMRLAWWMLVFPSVAIVMAVLGLNLVSDAINDALDPRR